MDHRRKIALFSASAAFALTGFPLSAEAADAPPAGAAAPDAATPPSDPAEAKDIVVTGIRSSLEKAAEIKRNAVQVVDSIVAQDIGKFPDPTTAAALQRVPGVQVQYDRGNELGNVRIRGLPDVLTTVNGREVFTTTGRSFNLTDLPAEALARVDVVKSQTADLIEGGLAGDIDLQLNKPFNFKRPTITVTARGNYGTQSNEFGPQVGILATTRWKVGSGEMGLLVNATWNKTNTYQPETTEADPRTTATAPLNTTANYIFPSILQNITQSGVIWHSQVNAAYQWQITPSVQLYVDGLYTATKNTVSYSGGGNVQPFTTGTSISNIVASDQCYTTRFNASGQNARVLTDASGRAYFENPANLTNPGARVGYTVQNLCLVKSATLTNVVINQTTHADNIQSKNKSVAGGLRFDRDGTKLNLDVAYQSSNSYQESVTADVGQHLPTVLVETDVDEGARLTIPGDALSRRDTLYLRNSISQNYQLAKGSLFALNANGQHEFDFFIKKIDFGFRYADRVAQFQQFQAVTPLPAGFGNLGTANEATAKRVVDLPLPSDFLEFGPPAPGINNGLSFLVPSVDFLRSQRGRDILRGIFGLSLGQPPYDPSRQFNANEKTYSGYGQASYEIPLFGDAVLDGVVGARLTSTQRTLRTLTPTTAGGVTTYVPTTSSKTDTDLLPNATARLDFRNGLQLRLAYAKTIRRPDFTLLNPTLQLTLSANPFLVNTGSAGNPNLQPQKSDSIDASVEYYFKSGYISVTGYYRSITNRVITSPALEEYGGNVYSVSRPRNVGKAELKGIELSGQYFFDFLPGALSGLGTFGAFTIADSQIQGNDPLAGNPLQGVSKYNFTAGLLYEKFGLSGRLVYTYRSKAWQEDQTGALALRPIDIADADKPVAPVLFRWMRPNGRLDFSLGYDINDHIRVDVGGTNVLGTSTKTYWGTEAANSQVFRIETTYTAGIRVRI